MYFRSKESIKFIYIMVLCCSLLGCQSTKTTIVKNPVTEIGLPSSTLQELLYLSIHDSIEELFQDSTITNQLSKKTIAVNICGIFRESDKYIENFIKNEIEAELGNKGAYIIEDPISLNQNSEIDYIANVRILNCGVDNYHTKLKEDLNVRKLVLQSITMALSSYILIGGLVDYDIDPIVPLSGTAFTLASGTWFLLDPPIEKKEYLLSNSEISITLMPNKNDYEVINLTGRGHNEIQINNKGNMLILK